MEPEIVIRNKGYSNKTMGPWILHLCLSIFIVRYGVSNVSRKIYTCSSLNYEVFYFKNCSRIEIKFNTLPAFKEKHITIHCNNINEYYSVVTTESF